MPAKTPKQQRFMAGCAENPSKMGGKCPPRSVAKEFSHKPKGGYSAKPQRRSGRGK